MLIQSGTVSTLIGRPWIGIELSSDARTDEIVLHLVRWAVRNLESAGKPFQLLYPVASRTSDAIELLSPYLWMRVPAPRDLWGIGSIMGVDWLKDASGNPILTSDEFVSTLIDLCRDASDAWSAGIEVGSGVRVLLGSGHGLCGIIETLRPDGDATVRITLRTRAVRLRIPVRALQRLTSEPKDYFEKEAD